MSKEKLPTSSTLSPLPPPSELNDRTLWPDGTTAVKPEQLEEFILKFASRQLPLSQLAVTESSPEVERYNRISEEKILVKTEAQPLNLKLALPERYKYLDLDEYLLGLAAKIEKDGLYEQRLVRLSEEIVLFKQAGLDELLRILIYVVETMREQKQIWGVGRGSSCSSYLLYLLGLHEVDPLRYGIKITDFIR